MLRYFHKQIPFLNICYSSTIQMVWVIFIHVIIEVIDISLTSYQTHAYQDKIIFTIFHFVIVSILVEWLNDTPRLSVSLATSAYGQSYFSDCNNRRMTFAHQGILLSLMQRIDKYLVALKDFDYSCS